MELFKGISEIAVPDKRDEFKQERMFRRVAKIPISTTCNGLLEMDFVDYGGKAAYPHLQDTYATG